MNVTIRRIEVNPVDSALWGCVRFVSQAAAEPGFDEMYVNLIANLVAKRRPGDRPSASRDGGRDESQRRAMERAVQDSARECLSDPSIIALIRRATMLRMRGSSDGGISRSKAERASFHG